MELSFKIDYQTTWGESLFISGSTPQLGQWDPKMAIPLKNQFPGEWQTLLEVESDQFEYKYLIKDHQGNPIWEWGPNRTIFFNQKLVEEIRLRDFWRIGSDPENALYSSAFQKVLLKREPSLPSPQKKAAKKTLRLQLHSPVIDPKYKFAILGADVELGSWKEADAIVMDDSQAPLWQVELDVSKLLKEFPHIPHVKVSVEKIMQNMGTL